MEKDLSVTVVINQQQEEMVQRLIAEGEYGSEPQAVIRDVFLRFCKSHPEFFRARAATT